MAASEVFGGGGTGRLEVAEWQGDSEMARKGLKWQWKAED